MFTKNLLKALILLTVCVTSTSGMASAFNIKDFNVYYGNKDNKGDIYLHSPELFVPIGSSIIIPIIIPSKGTIKYQPSTNTVTSVNINKNDEKSLNRAKSHTDYFYEDINKDGHLDVRVYSQSNDGSGIVFYGSNTLSDVTAVAFNFSDAPSSTAFARNSQIKALTSGIKVLTAKDSKVDILTPIIPIAGNISVNSFDVFSSKDRPIKILNNAGNYLDKNGTIKYKEPAKRIIISARNINLVNPIEVIGAPADIVIISPFNNGQIHCNGCSFKNTNRISLITGLPSKAIKATTTKLGEINSGQNSSISITNLYAPASIGVDLVTQSLEVSGTVNTHQYAIKTDTGYTEDINGNTVIGAAQINMILGQVDWVYETGQITGAEPSAETLKLEGDFRSLGINVVTNKALQVEAYIDTRTDIQSSSTYGSGVYVPLEGVKLTSLTSQLQNTAGIIVNKAILSNGEVSLKTTGNIVFNEAINDTTGYSLSAIAGKNIYNKTGLYARKIAMSANKLFNEGTILADELVELSAEHTLANQYGGSIIGNDIVLEAVTGVVRNGSRTPHISFAHETENLFDFSQENSWLDKDLTKQGVFYELFTSVLSNTSSLKRAEKSSAYIFGNNIRISAVGVENINPYYRKIENIEPLSLSASRLNAVVISAENSLIIAQKPEHQTANQYILNSSAYITLNNTDEYMFFDASTILNERYRVATVLDVTTENISIGNSVDLEDGEVAELHTDKVTLGAFTYVYSPPGRIVSFGFGSFNADKNFTNNLSYIELFSGAKISSPNVESLGVESQKLQNIKSGYRTSYGDPIVVDENDIIRGSFAILLPRNKYLKVSGTQQLDSLFYVKSGLDASGFVTKNDIDTGSVGIFTVTNLLHYLVEQTLSQELENLYYAEHTDKRKKGKVIDSSYKEHKITVYSPQLKGTTYREQRIYDPVKVDVDIDPINNKVIVTAEYEVDEKTYEKDFLYNTSTVKPSKVANHVSTTSYEVYDRLFKTYKEQQPLRDDLENETQWWNE